MKELDVVKLKDGREGTVIVDYNESCMVEISGSDGKAIETPIVLKSEIEKVLFSA